MGIYLNSETPYRLYKNETEKPYFVDKSLLLEKLFPLVEEGTNYICITRPRRFGKTVMANMITSFFSKAHDAADIFDLLKISEKVPYEKYRNKYAVIHISFNDISRQCATYEQYISRIERRLIKDLKKEYPDVELDWEESVVDVLMDITMVIIRHRTKEYIIRVLLLWRCGIMNSQVIGPVQVLMMRFIIILRIM